MGKENSVDSYHQNAAAHFDEPAILNQEAASFFECDSGSVASHHAYLALKLATLALKKQHKAAKNLVKRQSKVLAF